MKKTKGYFTQLDGSLFYKIENYDCMDDFFMTITSSSDIWNFCWSQGGLTAGRIDCDHAIFPYYTADKVSDAKSYTGPYTAIRSGNKVWEPFASLSSSPAIRRQIEKGISRNIYKNTAGTQVWFEEINEELKLSFRYGWTSSAKYGLIRQAVITNLSDKENEIKVLDGCRNILPACVDADFQNNNSVLLDAYKKTDLDKESNLVIFAVSSIVTDKAEPSEGLFANVCWFSTDDKVLINPNAANDFLEDKETEEIEVLKGKRPVAYVYKQIKLAANSSSTWFQVFDTSLDLSQIQILKKELKDRNEITGQLEKDLQSCKELMDSYISQADGFQNTAETMTCVHHSENVMFNIMRGGFFANGGKINLEDFEKFIELRNKSLVQEFKSLINNMKKNCDKEGFVTYGAFEEIVEKEMNPHLSRLFYEYMPLTFSRRHGDPSRPWNRFNIHLKDDEGNPILNYEGNWRDIFQNWEALAWSYPQYIKNMTTIFLNAMTIEGFNPYRISRNGIDWEIPDPNNPWAQIGYWGDHQIIYLQKLLEIYAKIDKEKLIKELDSQIYASSNVPYRIKSYKEIYTDPRNTIFFDRDLSKALKEAALIQGSDAKLVKVDGNPLSEKVALVSLTSKLLQLVIAKMANFVPGGGIWLNTQRPEWNDANNALAGYGLSMVTLYYMHRFINFLINIFEESECQEFKLPEEVALAFKKLGKLYSENPALDTAKNPALRKEFTDKEGLIFEEERAALYQNAYGSNKILLEKKEIISILSNILNHIKTSITLNRRKDGLYHSYNTMKLYKDRIEIEYLQEMLEGQVAVLSAGILKADEVLDLLKALRESAMYEPRQEAYMLYPEKELKAFEEKNQIDAGDIKNLKKLIDRSGNLILKEDCLGKWHFNGNFRNVRFLKEYCEKMQKDLAPNVEEIDALDELYEKTFNHQSFTGRSGTFYAYEGLGSIYWHMVSKLLLAVQENLKDAISSGQDKAIIDELTQAYYQVRKGIGFNKAAEVYGAFPADPYSHTPKNQGAKQPGMTGQVKEEVLTRWGELGLDIVGGCAVFKPDFLKASEYFEDGSLNFTWCGCKVTYKLTDSKTPELSVNGKSRTYVCDQGALLTRSESKSLFARDGLIRDILVEICK